MNTTVKIIKIQNGKIKGRKEYNFDNNIFYSFQNIPYAKPPVGKLRFMPPVPVESWNDDIFDATGRIVTCPTAYTNHMRHLPNIEYDEDCLRINVYTPYNLENNTDSLLPVMVYIYSGAFVSGTSDRDEYGPEFLVRKNIVLVTFNYRTGILGFLKLNDTILIGNSGLKDQVAALHWIQNNIQYFGGNPNNVTVFGTSAGGSCVHLLTLSSLTKNLFHKVIFQSGSALSSFVLNNRNDDTNLLIKHLNAPQSNNCQQILEHLQQMNLFDLLKLQRKIDKFERGHLYNSSNFTPTVESNKNPGAFITDTPFNLLKSGHFQRVPILTGFLENDGSVLVSLAAKSYKPNFSNKKIPFPKFDSLGIRNTVSSDKIDDISKLLYLYYYRDQISSYQNKEIYWEAATDMLFAFGIRQSINIILELQPDSLIYYYKFNLNTQLNKKFGFTKHLDDENHLFNKIHINSINFVKNFNSDEAKAVDLITTLWTNFAKTNNPNPNTINSHIEWKPAADRCLNYFEISLEPKVGIDPNAHRLEFLEILYKITSKL